MTTLRELALDRVSVPATATLEEAAVALRESGLSAIAVLDGERVVGVFSDLDVLRGIFPAYLAELRHTAFLEDDVEALEARARAMSTTLCSRLMREPHALDADASPTHAAERFLHGVDGAIPVVEQGRFLGMLSRAELARAMLSRAGV